MRNVLSIAGSDSSGGAGIQADLKTFCALGVYGMTAITAITAQNTQGVVDVGAIPEALVAAQVKAVFDDIRVDAVKVGMLFDARRIAAVKESLVRFSAPHIVFDPVMVSKSGHALMAADAIDALREFAAIAEVITPNIPEAELLSGIPIQSEAAMLQAAELIAQTGVPYVLIKGGHAPQSEALEVRDLLFSGETGGKLWLGAPRIATVHTHGTGCSLSSALAARLALGDSVEDAARFAKAYITQAIKDAYPVGKGAGPIGHLAALYRAAALQA